MWLAVPITPILWNKRITDVEKSKLGESIKIEVSFPKLRNGFVALNLIKQTLNRFSFKMADYRIISLEKGREYKNISLDDINNLSGNAVSCVFPLWHIHYFSGRPADRWNEQCHYTNGFSSTSLNLNCARYFHCIYYEGSNAYGCKLCRIKVWVRSWWSISGLNDGEGDSGIGLE